MSKPSSKTRLDDATHIIKPNPELKRHTPYNTHITQKQQSTGASLEHGLEVVGNAEGSLSLGLDLVNGDAVGDLDEGKAVGEVDVEDALL